MKLKYAKITDEKYRLLIIEIKSIEGQHLAEHEFPLFIKDLHIDIVEGWYVLTGNNIEYNMDTQYLSNEHTIYGYITTAIPKDKMTPYRITTTLPITIKQI